MRIMLAPMEGVVEHHVRDILSRIGGLDGCVTEFIRVTDQKLPYKVFYKYAQELESDCKTPNGTPVRVQLLGSKPEPMAINALELVRYGAKAIDLNFGCPAKTVNSHEGGACLLRTPDRVYSIIKAVRDGWPERRLVMIYQPHRYTRTRDLYVDFVEVLSTADALVMLEVYSAGEDAIPGADSRHLCRSIRARGVIEPIFVETVDGVPAIVKDIVRAGDIVITQGAGNVGVLSPELAKRQLR